MECSICGAELGQRGRRNLEREVWLRCKKCKQLTKHVGNFSDNPGQHYICQECGETRIVCERS